MNIWFMLWVFFAVFIMGVFFWSLQILMRQKTAWKQVAKRHNLNYVAGGMMSSPIMSGAFRNYGLSVYSEAQLDEDARGKRYRTVIQMELKSGMPTEGVIASAKLSAVASQLDLQEVYTPDTPDWNHGTYIRTRSEELLAPYFTPARTKAINALMTINGVNVLFVFNEKDTLLRFETPDPLDDVSKMERLINKIADAADILSV
ncbi:MAG: hypothetical protein KDJ26_08320 [Alphaproteobacteria bacterium]|nr:hypothetical protein [Alphaproteobacteria bacterium]MCB1551986.1 hypothetical protein [Alphaproteobacteria bacterium]MCB9984516.1 hypothetical protein [Micavibrio sp.]